MREAKIDRAGCFAYSPVEGAKANELEGALPDEVREERQARFMAVAEEISAKLLEAKVGKRIRVLVDSVNGSRGVGRSQSDAPEIDGLVHLLPTDKISKRYRVGEFVKATVVGTQGHDLIAQL
jgi:ribosomal protein S12 methylthiotransferase